MTYKLTNSLKSVAILAKVHNKSYNQWRVMSKYKVLSSLLRLVTVDSDVFKAATGYSQTLATQSYDIVTQIVKD